MIKITKKLIKIFLFNFLFKNKQIKNSFILFLPKFIAVKLESAFKLWESLSIFRGKKLLQVNNEYWKIDPMPNKIQLEKYYQDNYWQNYRSNPGELIRSRDLEHFLLIVNHPEFSHGKKTFLNFGSGTGGGISHLMYILGNNIINIEPGPMVNPYNLSPDYKHKKALRELPSDLKVDFFYASHSLEHVAELTEIEEFIKSKVKLGGYIFFEVPNALVELAGLLKNKVDGPHTYYFTRKYFENLGLKVLFNSTYSNGIEMKSDEGEVIRFYAKVI